MRRTCWKSWPEATPSRKRSTTPRAYPVPSCDLVSLLFNIFLLYASEPLPTGQVHLWLGGWTGPARPHQRGETVATGREVRTGQKILGGWFSSHQLATLTGTFAAVYAWFHEFLLLAPAWLRVWTPGFQHSASHQGRNYSVVAQVDHGGRSGWKNLSWGSGSSGWVKGENPQRVIVHC